MISLFWPTIFKDESLIKLEKIFSNRWIGQGPAVDRFEKEFSKKFGDQYCISVNSGTAALELAYNLIGLKKGDEVITTVFTCTATNIPLKRIGVKIIFADIEKETFTIDTKDIEKKITRKTKAIVGVNLGGLFINDNVCKIAEKYNIPLVIDACQSLGIKEKRGDFVCYSFQAIKHFTTGDGGMLIVRDEQKYKEAKKLRWFGIDRDKKRKQNWKCLSNREITMDIKNPGYKFHMSDISATLGLIGLKHSDNILSYRIKLSNIYKENMVRFPEKLKFISGGSHWLFAILLKEKRNEAIEYLRKNDIETDLVQLRNDIFTVFGGKRLNLPNMNEIENQYMYLPLNTKITTNDIDRICKCLLKFLQ